MPLRTLIVLNGTKPSMLESAYAKVIFTQYKGTDGKLHWKVSKNTTDKVIRIVP